MLVLVFSLAASHFVETYIFLSKWGFVTAVYESSTEGTLQQFCIFLSSDSTSSKPCTADYISASMELT
jgi:hypothetical protein